MEQGQFKDGTYEIIGAALEVHKILGPGLLEAVYQEALAIEFELRKIPYRREVEIRVEYKGRVTDKSYRVDFVCGEVIVELKALKELSDWEKAVALNYLKLSEHEVALLINFGEKSLRYERYVNMKQGDKPDPKS